MNTLLIWYLSSSSAFGNCCKLGLEQDNLPLSVPIWLKLGCALPSSYNCSRIPSTKAVFNLESLEYSNMDLHISIPSCLRLFLVFN